MGPIPLFIHAWKIFCNKVKKAGLTSLVLLPALAITAIAWHYTTQIVEKEVRAGFENGIHIIILFAGLTFGFTLFLMMWLIEASRKKTIQSSSLLLKERSAQLEDSNDQLKHLATHDPLTGLPNRLLLYDRINQVLPRAIREKRHIALLFLDLDRFKNINDTLGHATGDQLLKEVSERLLLCIRDGDTISRVGGDEFVIVLVNVAAANDVPVIAKRILDSLSQPFSFSAVELFVTASIGISLFPDDAENSDILVKNADTAMYHAKAEGKNNYQFFSSSMNIKMIERLGMENSLRHAIDRKELLLYYQPVIELRTGRITGMEALVRWRPPNREMISPGEFIPLAEETGLIIPMGEWILRHACVQNKAWQDAGLSAVRVAVNISARQISEKHFVDMVQQTLAETGLAPHHLELEITESAFIKNTESTIITFFKLHHMGVQISLDDFGTGYSSLSYLKKFPIHTLKIDQSFIKEITNPDTTAIVTAIVGMAHALKLKVIAEGVELKDQKTFLQSISCDEVQGYFFSRPLPAEEFRKLLLKEKKSPAFTLR